MDLPADVLTNFINANSTRLELIQKNIISKETFFKDYFFPNLTDVYWKEENMLDDRNKLIMHVIEDEKLTQLVMENECIPVKPNGILRKPKHLVLQNGPLGTLFDIGDERFPVASFDSYSDRLVKLGMMQDNMSSEILLERARSVQEVSKKCHNAAVTRSSVLIKYLNDKIEKHDDILAALKDVAFLQCMSKPHEWPEELPWKGGEQIGDFLPPKELFCPSERLLVGSVGCLLGFGEPVDKRILRLIGIQKVTTKHVIQQLEVIGKSQLMYSDKLRDICDEIYNRLNLDIKNKELAVNLEEIKNDKIICSGGQMVEVHKVAFKLDGDCTPYLYQMDDIFQRFHDFWQCIGVSEHFDVDVYLKTLNEIKCHFGENKLHTGDIDKIVNILKNLCLTLNRKGSVLTLPQKHNLFIPDSKDILRNIKDICYDDGYRGLAHNTNRLHVIHNKVKEKWIVESLGIVSKRQLHLSTFSNVSKFGQKEELVTRLRNIIESYPCRQAVLNELLQNADDAEATKVHFVLDLRQHGKEHIFCDEWKPLQGPSLCFFNNASFSENDLRKIQTLGDGSKVSDSTKIGQFGVGFNVVYHLTDVPSFLSKGPTTPNGGTFCVFDPHCKYVASAEPDVPGIQIGLDVLQDYPDVEKAFLQNEVKSDVGTWFRFPLRTREMAKTSSISTKEVDENCIMKMMEDMKKEAKTCLLFLRNVKEISFSHIKTDSSNLIDSVTISLEIDSSKISNHNQFFSKIDRELQKMKSGITSLKDIQLNEVVYEAKTKDHDGRVDSWLVCQVFGFPNTADVSEKIFKALAEKQLILSPRGGAAICIDSTSLTVNGDRKINGKAYCFLPLPIDTGMPVHVNGHFVLDESRKNIFEVRAEENVKFLWNKIIINQIIAHSYASCINYFKNKLQGEDTIIWCELRNFFRVFPIYSKAKSDLWRDLTLSVYKHIYKRQLEVFPVSPDFFYGNSSVQSSTFTVPILRWCPLGLDKDFFQTVFDDLQYLKVPEPTDIILHSTETDTPGLLQKYIFDRQHELRSILVDLGMNLICTPIKIKKSINEACKNSVAHKGSKKHQIELVKDTQQYGINDCLCSVAVTPQLTIDFLKSDQFSSRQNNVLLQESVFKTTERLMSILSYCLRDEKFTSESLCGLPLLLTNSNMLLTFTNKNSLFLSEFCDLFVNSASKFVHQCQVETLIRFKNAFHALDSTALSELLHGNLNCSLYKQPGPIDWDKDSLFEDWLCRAWDCLHSVDDWCDELKRWCILPCLWWNGETKLISIDRAYVLVEREMEASNSMLTNLIAKMDFPRPQYQICHKERILEFVATEHNPGIFIQCLHFHQKHPNWIKLDTDDCNTVLKFFNDAWLSKQILDVSNLKSLPCFPTVFESICELATADKVLIVKSEYMTVFDGIEDLCKKTKTVLIKFNAHHEQLYKLLGMTKCYPIGRTYEHPLLTLYTNFIFPHFPEIDENAHLSHLQYVKDQLLKFGNMNMYLTGLKFIPQNGELRRGSDFYSPHNTIFSELCKSSELPPAPYNENEWKEFMECSGMHCEVTAELFLDFAKRIQREGRFGIQRERRTVESDYHAKLLIEYLFTSMELQDDEEFLRRIRTIKFIPPFVVPDNYKTVCEQSNVDSLISFQCGISPDLFELCWSLESILPIYAVSSNKEIVEKLTLKTNPRTEKVISQVHLVCQSFIQKGRQDNSKEFVIDLMMKFYEYFKNCERVGEHIHQIIHTPIVYIVEHDTFRKASEIVLQLPKNMEIPLYLMKCSDCFGDYFKLFRDLGASDEVNIQHYCMILNSIDRTVRNFNEKTRKYQLTPDELRSVDSAIIGLLQFLKKCKSDEDIGLGSTELLMLNEQLQLKPSSQLTFNDNPSLRNRLNNQTSIDFLEVSNTVLHYDLDLNELLKRLPEKNQPRFLSEIVEEKIVHTSNTRQCNMALQLENILTSKTFMYILNRVVRTYKRRRHKKIDEEEINQIEERLKLMRVLALVKLETALYHEEVIIESSTRSKAVFYDKSTNALYVKHEENLTENWMFGNSFYLAVGIQKLTQNNAFTYDIQNCLPFVEYPLTEVENILNDLGMADINFIIDDTAWYYPIPGTPVPIDFVDFLCSDFPVFEAGDRAVYEVFDNTGDEDEEKSMYIYVKIIKKLTNKAFPLYLVNIGEETEKEIHSFKLYKLVRPLHEMSTDVELHTEQHTKYSSERKHDIFESIEEDLLSAWQLGPDAFKSILKRLLLRWHPDKNDNSSFCGEVFIHLTEFAKTLQSNQTTANDEHEHQESEFMHSGFDRRLFDVENFAERVGQKRERQHKFKNTDPQPHMGRIWIDQATDDLDAAKALMSTGLEKSFNWVCVQSHQAAEKALKAVQIVKDANMIGHDHFLTAYIPGQSDVVQEAAIDLERVVVNYSRMRYPRPALFPDKPSELYKEKDAKESIRLASVIVSNVIKNHFS